MYLKSIEIQGFKSFANKTRLEFHQGFTAIVGPNGSGKSNIGDAVRWVLGEQRVKQLRGGSMQDVIFAGTELRKPMSYAYVAITMDNSDHALPVDFTEVTVARKLYRSGESEYLLNGTQVRLRDVQELFYDTGVGKEGYSIIGQGQIDRILSDKPEDRRELFDEAAGIVKFKRRKEQALKKLESEQSNLVRVSDILSELEKQVGPLEKQAEKAQVYLKAREEQKTLDVNVFLMENEKTDRQAKEVQKNLETAQAHLSDTTERYEKSKTEYDEIEEKLTAVNAAIEEERDFITKAGIAKKELENNIALFEEQIRSAKSNAEHFDQRKEALTAGIREREEKKAAILTGKSGIDEKLRDLEDEKLAAETLREQAEARVKEKEQDVETLRESILALLSARAEIKAKQAAHDTRREQFDIRRAELTSRLVAASSDEAEHEEKLRELQAVFHGICGELSGMQEEEKALEEKIQGLESRIAEKERLFRNTEAQYHQEKSRLDALVNLTERYEGFGGAVRAVMEKKAEEPGVVGVVADLVKTDSRYETAIETALGGQIQNIVTKDNATTRKMISYLKQAKAGRATFLPLDAIRGGVSFNQPQILRERGVIGLADTLVRIDPEYRDVASNLLGRTVVVDTYDNAHAITVKYGPKVRMVTLQGEMFNVGGSVSGGAFRNKSNLLGRRREIDGLEKTVKELKEKLAQTEEETATARKERNLLRAKLDTLNVSMQGKFLEQNTAKMNITQEEEKKKESEKGFASLKSESSTIEETKNSLAAEEKKLKEELAVSERTEEETNARILEKQRDIADLRADEEEKAKAVQSWDLELSRMRQKQDFEQQELDRIAEEIENEKKELAEVENSIALGKESIDERRENIEKTRAAIEAGAGKEKEQAEKLRKDQEEKAGLEDRQKKILEERDGLSQEKADLDKEVFRLDEQRKKLEASLEDAISYMWSEYEITLSDAEKLRNPELTNLEEMKKRIRELKNQIRNLGPVNVNAIEEYAEASQRCTFLRTQHDDLVAAADSLKKIIDELDVNMRRQFKAQFARIQEEFDKVFKELFGGGSGKLELMEDEDILEAGVRVIAQPPGKKLQNMMQMSGGEKALTAISLLFAIQNLKPSPFCLLDEIEAALDESNVVRFAQYIHKLTEHTQFIVVTHRRGTMDEADRLYGITMQEKGVSTLVSVSLINDSDLVS